MFKEILRGLTMLAAIITIALATAAVSTNAQNRLTVTADIPFEFMVGDTKLPAGSYRVRATSDAGDVLLISNDDGKGSVFRLAREIRDGNHKGVSLMFRRYGDQNFLSVVWTGQTGQAINKSRRQKSIERELATIAGKTELADKNYKLIEVVASLR